MPNTRQKVLQLLLQVPKGKAVSYAELARAAGTSPRAVGAIMRSNKETRFYSCYKVVHADGRIGNYSGKGGKKRKISLLKRDGVVIKNQRTYPEQMHRF